MIVITFFTHHSAMVTCKALKASGINSKMAPVPRELSSSCGTCVIADTDMVEGALLDEDTEAMYSFDGKNYTEILRNE